MPVYSSRYVHKISPRETDVGPNVTIPDTDPLYNYARSDMHKHVGRILRGAKLLGKGERVHASTRWEGGRLVAFPVKSIWHSIILTPIAGGA